MAAGEQTGATLAEVGQLKQAFLSTPAASRMSFEESYCLKKIGKQPEDYAGPQRYCKNRSKTCDDGTKAPFCRFHGGRSVGDTSNLTPLGNMTHGFFSNRKNLLNNLAEHEREFYEEVMYDWPDKYEIDFESDPSAMEDMHALALEIIRDHRAGDEIDTTGLTTQKSVYDATGREVGQEDQAHHLLGPGQAQRKLVMSMKDALGISRKHRDQLGQAEDASKTVAGLIEGMSEALDKDKHDYDPDQFEE